MATRKIETTIALDGEQQFKQALAAAAREMRVLESESRALSAAYDDNGSSASAYAARQQNLRSQIQQQEQIVTALERAVRDSAETYGEASSQTDGWSIKLNNARARLSRLQKELESTDREAEELGRDSGKVGRQIENGIGDGARDAGDSVNSLFEAMQKDISSIKTSGAIQAVGTLWDMVSGAYSSVEGFVSGTVEYRRQLSFLQVNAENNGFDFGDIKSQLTEVTALTGDASASIEGLSNLMAVPGMDANTLTRAIDGLSGAVISFPDTVKFESLADSLQETIAAGEATGQFSELLSRMGVSTEDFNSALAESKTEAGDLEIALAYLAAGGMTDVYEKWQDTNAELIKNAEQTAELEDAYAALASELEPITTGIKELWTEVVNGATDAIVATKKALDDWAAEQGWTEDTSGATGGVDPWFWGTQTDYTESPYEIVNGKLVEKGNATAAAAQTAGTQAADAFRNGFELGLDASLWGEGTEAEKIVTISPVEMEEAGEEAGTAMSDGFEEGVSGMEGVAENAGAAIGAAFGSGLASQISYVSASAAALAGAAAAGIRAAGQLGALQGARAGGIPIVINLDGRQVGTGIAPFASSEMAAAVNFD